MVATINASVSSSGIVSTADGSGIIKVQSNGVTTNALAWVNFNGTTSPGTIRSQYNVSSVTKGGTGSYTVNFTTSLSDANYCVTGTGSSNSTSNVRILATVESSLPTISSCPIYTLNDGGVQQDPTFVSFVIFGN